ncbi:MAG: type II toxin-antitoxin system prevent-host-death family antitoxin [Actinomycetota bacterium]|nr:type II toxin-antitoxin system prevent-host-death family antitoxin [Actinomycetota bacterium]
MRSIGVRELRQNASRYLREVKRGATVEVTERGEPVARLVPVPDGESNYERMVAEGRIIPGRGNLLDVIDPIGPEPGERPLSEILEEMRADERW